MLAVTGRQEKGALQAREPAGQLRALTAVPSSTVRRLTMPVTAAPEDLTTSSGLHTYVTYTYTDIHTYTEEKIL